MKRICSRLQEMALINGSGEIVFLSNFMRAAGAYGRDTAGVGVGFDGCSREKELGKPGLFLPLRKAQGNREPMRDHGGKLSELSAQETVSRSGMSLQERASCCSIPYIPP
jgi:hypothetical protein